MKLIISDGRVIGTARNDYEGAAIDAPADFDPARITDYRVAQDGTLSLQPAATAVPLRAITYWAFRKRFTQAERVGLEMAALDDPGAELAMRHAAAAVRVYLADTAAAKWVDLDDADTQQGLQALEAMGLLTTGRAADILWAPVQPAETVPS